MLYALHPPRVSGPGYPYFLEGYLVRDFNPRAHDPDDPDTYDPAFDPDKPLDGGPLPGDLTLVTDETLYTDYHSYTGGHLVTDAFLAAVDGLNLDGHISVPIAVRAPDGASRAGRRYHYLVFRDRIDAVDYSASEFKVGPTLGPYRAPTEEERRALAEHRAGTRIRVKEWDRLVLRDDRDYPDLFQVTNGPFVASAFSSDAFKSAAEDARLEGFDFVAVDELATWEARRVP